MGGVLPLPEPDRVLRAVLADARDEGRGLRATWHLDAGLVVLSLWRGSSCVGTSRLTPGEAGRLAALLTTGLATLAGEAGPAGPAGPAGVVPFPTPPPAPVAAPAPDPAPRGTPTVVRLWAAATQELPLPQHDE